MDGISEVGVYELDDRAYHADPCSVMPSLSASVGKVLLAKSPLHAFSIHPRLSPDMVPENKRAFDLGSAAHKLMLGKGKGFRPIDAEDYRSKDAREARDMAWANGEIPLLTKEQEELMTMYRVGKRELQRFVDSGDLPIYPFSEGKPEQCLVWVEKTRFGDVWCRSLFDWLPDQIDDLYDYKSTGQSANPADWSIYLMRKMGFVFQATFYRRAVRALALAHDPNFRFIVHEIKAPYALSVIGVDPEELDETEADVQRAIDIWAKCVHANDWPGYSPFTVIPERSEWQKERDAEKRTMREGNDHLSSEDIAATI